jgi:lysophospholipid acyltransferase (LPLAT)-like uncharacterized protein
MEDRLDTSLIQPRSRRGWASSLRRRFLYSEFAYGVLSSTVTAYLRTVWATSRLTAEPTSFEPVFERHAPLIAVTWHSEAFLLPLLRPRAYPVDVIVSRASVGEIISRTLHKLGCGTVRGSGATDRVRMFENGAVAAFRGLKAALDSGHSVGMTADFDARTHGTVSPGVIALARLSQRPIIPAVVVSSNRFRVRTWTHGVQPAVRQCCLRPRRSDLGFPPRHGERTGRQTSRSRTRAQRHHRPRLRHRGSTP